MFIAIIQPYFVCIIDVWKWDIRDRDLKKFAERSPAFLHVKYKELLGWNQGPHLFNMGQEELPSLLLAFPESLAHSVVQGAHGSLWPAAFSRTRALLAQIGGQLAQPNQA